MPRGNFLEASGGGLKFVEGYVRIDRSISKMFQYPPNSETKEQSEAFPAMVWEGIKLTPEWKPILTEDGTPETFEIINRMGTSDVIRPGLLDPKDFNDVNIEPKDLTVEVNGAEGNSFFFEPGAKFHISWGIMKESLEKYGFKSEILGRCVTTDFEGTVAHFKTEKGKGYIAKKGKNVGKEVVPENLVCDRIQIYGYDVAAKDKAKPVVKKDKAGAGATAGAATTTAAAGNKPNGAAESAGATSIEEVAGLVGEVLVGLSDKFKAEIPAGTTVKRAVFQKSLTYELLRNKTKPNVQKDIMDFVKSDNFAALGEATELFKVEGDSVTLSV